MGNEDPIILEVAKALEPGWWELWAKHPTPETELRCRLSIMQARTAARVILEANPVDLERLGKKLSQST
jgi:hypothetical protein